MSRRTDPNHDADHGYDGPSKTQVKKEMLELQALAQALQELPAAQLDAIEMDETLRNAFIELRRLKAHSALKRQIQYLGKLLSRTDVTPFRLLLSQFQASRTLSARAQHEVEEWRARLLSGDEGWTAWLSIHPDSDTPQLRALLRDARRETEAGKSGRAYRELFRTLRTALQA